MGRRTPSSRHNQNISDDTDSKTFDYNAYLDKRLGTKPVKSSKNGNKILNVFFLGLLLVIILAASGVFVPKPTAPTIEADIKAFEAYNANSDTVNLVPVTIYSSTTCGCCHQYVDYLSDLGFDVNFVKDDVKYLEVKDDFSIPDDHRSCHTTVIGDYFAEGHIPASTLYDMITELPDIDGIALSGMPAGSPGMGGEKSVDWKIYSIDNGEATGIFKTI